MPRANTRSWSITAFASVTRALTTTEVTEFAETVLKGEGSTNRLSSPILSVSRVFCVLRGGSHVPCDRLRERSGHALPQAARSYGLGERLPSFFFLPDTGDPRRAL